ncbi:MAG TPA: DNA repair protein RecO [Acidimicrobiales bacterium]|nr:DNA repair protein RecO [Acidimicrobiales bacterium]
MPLYRDRGVVLRTYRLGEADRIVVIFTEGHGKVRAVAKGVRKTKSRFGARLEPTSHVALLLYEGRELDVVTQADSIDHHPAVRADLGRLAKATAVVEAVDHVSQDREPDANLYRMLVGALRALEHRDSPLLVPAFYWKVLAAEGVAPLLESCARCGATSDLVAFDLVEGGVLCRACRSGTPISPAALALLRRVLLGELNAALAEPPGPAVQELDALATTAFEAHVERRLKANALHLDR